MKKSFDHHPHDMFVELSELKQTPYGPEWRETARWVKYEEDVEGVQANRWGKPHVAFLNFHSLFSLRKGLDRGAVLLDLEEKDLQGIATRVVEHMVACDQVPADQKEAVINTLLLRHRHVAEDQFKIARRESKTALDADGNLTTVTTNLDSSSTGNLSNNLRSSFKRANIQKVFSSHSIRRHSSFDQSQLNRVQSNGSIRERLFSIAGKPEDLNTFNPETGEGTLVQESFQNTELMKKLPDGAEATTVLVGAVDFLKQPTIAFVRLSEGIMMDNLVEVPIPVRFLFVLLGPYHTDMDYHEVGRSISTLMSDKHFHEVAYRAHSRSQLLSAINEFLNASIVLPPAEWSNTDLIPVDQIRDKAKEMMRRKETIRQKRLESEPVTPPPTEPDAPRSTLRNPRKPPPRDPLKRVGKPFYGIIQDVKERAPFFISDFRDGLSGQVLSAAIFIFFASLSPAITFGGMYGAKTEQLIGVGETLLVTCINGCIMALFSCQPLLILGATGPLMIFDLALYSFAHSYGMEFLPMRCWISIWMTAFVVLISAFEGVTIVKHLTRFTEEIFSTLVCLIFIYGALEKLIGIFMENPLLSDYCYEDANHTEILQPKVEIVDEVVLGNASHANASDTLAYQTINGTLDAAVNLTNSTVANLTAAAGNDTDAIGDAENINATIINGTLFNGTNAAGDLVDFASQPQPNTALLSLILMIGTFIIAFKLKKFRNSKYLGRGVRRALGDFGVPISIVLMVLLDYFIEDTYTDKLTMPVGIQPSNPEMRGWIINPFGIFQPLPVWVIFACAPASLLLFILIFIEENICQLILSKPEKNMKKGSGFHWDLFLSCAVNVVSGFMGAPFMTPACVRTISHVSALTVVDTKVAPGEPPKIVGAHEQRLSAFVVSALVGLSIFLSTLLNLVPNSVLYGVFLYMGISATAGIQFLERMILFIVPVKHHPNMPFVKSVSTRKMHFFTLVQLTMIVVLWVVKQSPAALCFPFVLMILVPIRLYLLPYLWNPAELHALDGGAPPSDDKDEPDFYEQSHNLGTIIHDEDHTHSS